MESTASGLSEDSLLKSARDLNVFLLQRPAINGIEFKAHTNAELNPSSSKHANNAGSEFELPMEFHLQVGRLCALPVRIAISRTDCVH